MFEYPFFPCFDLVNSQHEYIVWFHAGGYFLNSYTWDGKQQEMCPHVFWIYTRCIQSFLLTISFFCQLFPLIPSPLTGLVINSIYKHVVSRDSRFFISLDVYYLIVLLILNFFRSLHFPRLHRFSSWATTSWARSLRLWPSLVWPHCCVSTWIITSSNTSIHEPFSSCPASNCCVCKGTGCISCTPTLCARCPSWTHITSRHSGELQH